MSCKSLYKGFFNFTSTVYIERCMAYTSRQAWLILCRRIAKKQGVSPQMVMAKFDGSQDNYSVQVEIAFTEEETGLEHIAPIVERVIKKLKNGDNKMTPVAKGQATSWTGCRAGTD